MGAEAEGEGHEHAGEQRDGMREEVPRGAPARGAWCEELEGGSCDKERE